MEDRTPVQVAEPEVTAPTSAQEASDAFGDGDGLTVVGGGTLVMPLFARGEVRPRRALLLHAAGLNGVSADGDTVRIGAMATLEDIAAVAPEPLASAARIPDPEIRAQATLGGNLHWQGDLQAPLIALRAQVRSTGAGGEVTEPIEAFLARDDARLVLEVAFARPRSGAYVDQRRIHAATYTVLSVAVARWEDCTTVAVGGMGPRGIRCESVERALAGGADGPTAAAAADLEGHDDALASAWYRRRVLPVLIARALNRLEETA
jgi:CO/xanthine dehydrogenase FAD-binding subunit